MELTSSLGVMEPSPGILLLHRLGLYATATVMQGGQKGLLFGLEKKSVAETLVFLKVPTTGAGWQNCCLGPPPPQDPALPFSLGVSLGSWPSLHRRSGGQHSTQKLQPILRSWEPPRHSEQGISSSLHSQGSLGWP